MSEPFVGNEMSEDLESTEERIEGMQELHEMTVEPRNFIEGNLEVGQSEAIESSFNDLVDTTMQHSEEQIENSPVPQPPPKEVDENSIDPRSIFGEGGELSVEITTAGKDDEVLPIPLPREADDVGGTYAPGSMEFEVTTSLEETGQVKVTYDGYAFAVQPDFPASSAEATPINTPYPVPPEAIESTAEATPINTPYPVPPDEIESTAEATPINTPYPVPPEVLEEGTAEATPINTPYPVPPETLDTAAKLDESSMVKGEPDSQDPEQDRGGVGEEPTPPGPDPDIGDTTSKDS